LCRLLTQATFLLEQGLAKKHTIPSLHLPCHPLSFEIYKASVIWDGIEQVVDVAASEADPLVGMGLLYGFKIQIEAVEGGRVTIEALK